MVTARLKSDVTTPVLTNRHNVFWPEHGYTKGDVLNYYPGDSDIRDRPQSLRRHVDGYQGKGFFSISRDQPAWVQKANETTNCHQT